ncbi:hypothetical protein BS47DRAFT_265 [Hydnum rufescens UP504]|uniref:P-loop containing nucleoside triphosphate hydrolase protein n=1 Tax=Hydnum rufescens UP504 TaxID=1448309 RepID=A0A9P6DZW7_9AGAM|nr:hypothetical protein BS47DRAFT_265 [Hydnum rufescens UP504]
MDLFGSVGGFFSGSSSLIDGAKLVLIGGTIETARRVGQSAWSSFLSSFYLTAHFSEEDYPYDWLQYWLQRQPQWRSSREFETTTRTTTTGLGPQTTGDEFEDLSEDRDADDELTPGKQKMTVVFQPTFDSTIGIYYRKHWLRVRRWKNSSGTEQLSISVVARNNSVLKQLVLEAKKLYEADAEHRVNIYFADSHGSWRWTDSRTKRPMSSIVLNKGVKEMLLADTRDFLKSEKWYATRGIPFRRGYLLHGLPGSGKTSLIHALAGALALDIYVVSLSASWINDATLSTLMGRVPARCIVLLEDLDAAFTRSASRDDESSGIPTGSKGTSDVDQDSGGHRHHSSFSRRRDFIPDYNTLSLSGLLNSLDGVSAPEGRLLFATTNHLERLDPALTRPGRMDIWIEFKHASKWQAELLFKNFFSEIEDAPPQPTAEEIAAMEKEFAFLEAQQNAADGKVSFVPKDGTATSPTAGAEAMATAMEEKAKDEAQLPPPVLERPSPPPDPARLAVLARQFAAAIPEEEHSVASLQGYLLRNKSRPEAAVAEAPAWVQAERELRIRLRREKEERETKLAIDREKRRKEREEAKRRADREEARREREEQARIRKEDEEFAAEERRLAAAAALGTTGATSTDSLAATASPAVPGADAASTVSAVVPVPPVRAESPVPVSGPIPAPVEAAIVPTVVPMAVIVPATSGSPAQVIVSTNPVPAVIAGTPTIPGTPDSEVDGENPGAASIVLVKPQLEATAPLETV